MLLRGTFSILSHIVQHGLVAVDLHLIFEFGVDDGRHVGALIGTKIQDQSNLSAQLGVQHWTVQTPVGRILIYKQRAVMTVTPILGSHHVASTLAETSCGLQKLPVPSQVFAVIGVSQFQGHIGVNFFSDHLTDGFQIETLEGERVSGHVSIECSGVHWSNEYHVG